MRADPRAYLWDAVKAAEAVQRFTLGRTYESFLEDDIVCPAVERQLEIVGEALAQLARADPRISAELPDLPRIVAFRNILAHGYAGIDYETVWSLIWEKLPELLMKLRILLAAGGDPPGPAG